MDSCTGGRKPLNGLRRTVMGSLWLQDGEEVIDKSRGLW